MYFFEELSECLNSLFLEEEDLNIIGYFKTNRENDGIIINNYMYSLKYTAKNGDKRWTRLESGFSMSITTNNCKKIIKVNGKAIDNKVLKHGHDT